MAGTVLTAFTGSATIVTAMTEDIAITTEVIITLPSVRDVFLMRADVYGKIEMQKKGSKSA